jgi:uncharacterized protein YbcV (DUF1398 family)
MNKKTGEHLNIKPRVEQILENYKVYLENFTWLVSGTLTSPYKISNLAIQNAIKRACKMTERELGNYKMFWIIEKHSMGSYHIHFLYDNENSENDDGNTASIIEKNWQKVLGSAVKPNTKITSCKNKEQAIKYILKTLAWQHSFYGFEGDYWRTKFKCK